ncbi:hypothetical protein [Zavarzinella formosa]|nr:hypothetical protein [Zavarzinella formosa]
MNHIDFHATNSRLIELTDLLSAGCDSDFDAAHEELERAFAELRLAIARN